MKRFAIFALMVAFIMGSVSVVSAADLEISGSWRVAGHISDLDVSGVDVSEDHFKIASRARTTFEFVANEHLKAVTQLQFFNKDWGTNGAKVGDTHQVEARDAYIAFDVPNTPVYVQAGFQGFATPSATEWWAPYDDNAAGIVLAAKINEMMTFDLAWFRAEDKTTGIGAPNHDETDMFYVDLAVTGDGFEVTPWILFHHAKENAGNADTFFLAVSGSVSMFDPLTLAGDLYYGKTNYKAAGASDPDAFGLVISAAYAMDMFTPEVYLGYFTGAGKNDNDVMPMVSADTYKTTYAFDGSSLGGGNFLSRLWAISTGEGDNGANIATQSFFLGAALKDIKFIECLKHDLNLVYLKGTNDDHHPGYNEDDDIFSIDFNTKYQIYEQLAAITEIGYAKLDGKGGDVDGFGLTFGIKYDF